MITHISPLGSMDMLSQLEVDMLKRTASSDLYQLFRNCSLAVLNSGSLTDNSKELLSRFESFDINVLRRERGVKLEVINPPEEAFVDGRIIRSLQANLFAVLRDILFVNGQIPQRQAASSISTWKARYISPIWCSPFYVTPAPCTWAKPLIWSSAGVVTRLTKPNISMPVGWETSSACVS